MVETGEEREVTVVDGLGVQCDEVPFGQPPKKLTVPPLRTSSTAASQQAGLPTASITTSKGPLALDGRHYIISGDLMRYGAQLSGGLQAGFAASGQMNFAADVLGERGKHQSNRAGANDEDSLAGLEFAIVGSLHHASQGLGECGVGKGSIGGQRQ